MTWPTAYNFRDWLRSKKRGNESILQAAERLLFVVAVEDVKQAHGGFVRLDWVADWFDLAGNVKARRAYVSRKLAKHGIQLPR